jgi:dCTP deaminase
VEQSEELFDSKRLAFSAAVLRQWMASEISSAANGLQSCLDLAHEIEFRCLPAREDISMHEQGAALFPNGLFEEEATLDHTTGILPSQELWRLVTQTKEIRSTEQIRKDQIQPASLDLRLGPRAYRVPASFLPGKGRTVQDKLADLTMHEFELDSKGAVLEKGCVYIVPLLEALALKWRTKGITNPKSSIGRIDVFTRVITDSGAEFDRISENYEGPLYAEISPRTFSILVRKGSRLNQLRVKKGSPIVSAKGTWQLSEESGKLAGELKRDDIKKGVPLSIDIAGSRRGDIIGYRAKKHAGLIDVDKINHYDAADYWDPMYARRAGGIILDPGDFYILASKQPVRVPPQAAAEMIAYDTLVGEFRVHYAGFFDPGFGWSEDGGEGTRAVLEVRSHEVPFLIEDGQLVGRLIYERLIGRPDRLYGAAIGSSYQRQGLTLSKHFRPLVAG